MIVEPDFLNNWKTKMFIQAVMRFCDEKPNGNPNVTQSQKWKNQPFPIDGPVGIILRIWGHCQTRKQFRFENLTAVKLAAICEWEGDPDWLLETLLEVGFLDCEGDEVYVHEWDECNGALVRNWANGRNGGRKKSSQKETQQEPKENPNETQTKPKRNPNGTDGLDGLDGLDRIPPNPLAGGMCVPEKMVARWKRMKAKDRKVERVRIDELPNDCRNVGNGALAWRELFRRVGAALGRRESTPWTVDEALTLVQLDPPEAEVELIEKFYAARAGVDLAKEANLWKSDLATLLNQWASQVDRAGNHFRRTPGADPTRGRRML